MISHKHVMFDFLYPVGSGVILKKPNENPAIQPFEFLDDETESRFQTRLIHSMGASYLTALAVGGLLGGYSGWKNSLHEVSRNVRKNAIVNMMTSRGPFYANAAGILTLYYVLMDAAWDKWIEGKLVSKSTLTDEGRLMKPIAIASSAGMLYQAAGTNLLVRISDYN